ncbi:uncharacterized protein LOC108158000 [Drosophila miranda]|uniref:uncharacterized protein LOC108158000 n=1 Tax=Drosophila miranda TaxID=7229 RepID=UPI0007E6B01B|nr:uncharacterized protein LOC108158000 [Drosophila miranda]
MSVWCATVVLILWLDPTLCLGISNYDVRLESLEKIKVDEETLFEFNLKLIGRDRLLNGSLINHVDMDEQYDVWIDIATFKNGEWMPMNLKIRTKPCDFMKNIFGKYYQPSFLDSNFPTGDDLCPFHKGEYYVKNVAMSTDNWPSFTIKGLNRASFSFLKNGKLVGGFVVVINLFDRNT